MAQREEQAEDRGNWVRLGVDMECKHCHRELECLVTDGHKAFFRHYHDRKWQCRPIRNASPQDYEVERARDIAIEERQG